MMYDLVTAQSGEKLLNAANLVYIYQRLKIFHWDGCDINYVNISSLRRASSAVEWLWVCICNSHRAGSMAQYSMREYVVQNFELRQPIVGKQPTADMAKMAVAVAVVVRSIAQTPAQN